MKKIIYVSLLSSTLLATSSIPPAVADGHDMQKSIGETTALIPEAGLAVQTLKDGRIY